MLCPYPKSHCGGGLKEIDASIAKAREAVRFVKFSFSEIYGNAVAEVMVDKVKDLLFKLYNFTIVFIHQMCKIKVGVRGQNWKLMLMIHM